MSRYFDINLINDEVFNYKLYITLKNTSDKTTLNEIDVISVLNSFKIILDFDYFSKRSQDQTMLSDEDRKKIIYLSVKTDEKKIENAINEIKKINFVDKVACTRVVDFPVPNIPEFNNTPVINKRTREESRTIVVLNDPKTDAGGKIYIVKQHLKKICDLDCEITFEKVGFDIISKFIYHFNCSDDLFMVAYETIKKYGLRIEKDDSFINQIYNDFEITTPEANVKKPKILEKKLVIYLNKKVYNYHTPAGIIEQINEDIKNVKDVRNNPVVAKIEDLRYLKQDNVTVPGFELNLYYHIDNDNLHTNDPVSDEIHFIICGLFENLHRVNNTSIYCEFHYNPHLKIQVYLKREYSSGKYKDTIYQFMVKICKEFNVEFLPKWMPKLKNQDWLRVHCPTEKIRDVMLIALDKSEKYIRCAKKFENRYNKKD